MTKNKKIIEEKKDIQIAENQIKEELIKKPTKTSYKKIFVTTIILISIPLVLVGILFGYNQIYKEKIYPGVYVGDVNVGGLNDSEMTSALKSYEKKIKEEGIKIVLQNKEGKKEEVSVPLVKVTPTPSLYSGLYAVGRKGNVLQQLIKPITFIFKPYYTKTTFFIYDRKDIEEALKKELEKFEDKPQNASISISSTSPLSYEIIKEKSGMLFNYQDLITKFEEKLINLDGSSITAQLENFSPTISHQDAESMASKLSEFINNDPLTLNYIDEASHFKKEWKLTSELYGPWIYIERKDDNLVFAIQKEPLQSFLKKEISPYTDSLPEDAVFKVEGEKVIEFKASKTGQEIDVEKVLENINTIFTARQAGESATTSVQITLKTIDPTIKTADVNNLGITDIVGIGISSFKGSHTNRIKNIAHAVERLNGTLIKPDEEFSANKYAGPYTYENGYLPELVIKGDEVKPEVGGGMCQIGTTLFRMAMNSGMDITQRANHSLVVNYYADPVNGNPGTDATLYDPIHDLKFKNDTGNYLLLQTDVDFKKQELTFTLWGKPDGRRGSYTHPVVHRWLGIGAPREVVVDTLKPGQRNCQGAYRGAEASFTYTRITPSGEKIDRVFNSYYRSLPQICMIGKTETAPVCPEGQNCSPLITDPKPIIEDVVPEEISI